MIRVLAILTISVLPVFIKSQDCPKIYQRLSTEHSFCKPPNPQCEYISKGIEDKSEIEEILKAHNDFRSKVAMGDETRAGGLPSASNMLELTWDEEMAAVAQKWAEQCHFAHDCGPCRSTPSFSVGQNIAYEGFSCSDGSVCQPKEPNWQGMIAMFYNEVADFDKNLIKAVNISGEKMIGHFTQVTWAKTYKVGCGRASYKEKGLGNQFYVCNYGPAGNMDDAPLYEEGLPCSNCPLNSCCGDKCPGGTKTYPGLCQLTSLPPDYPTLNTETYLYVCTFKKGDPNCKFSSEGARKWELTETAGGTFLSVVVEENGIALVHFHPKIKVKKGTCMKLFLRRGPNIAGEKDDSKQEVIFEQNGKKYPPSEVWSFLWSDFMAFPVQIEYEGDIKFSIKFSVPAGAPPQFLEINRIEITEKSCFQENDMDY